MRNENAKSNDNCRIGHLGMVVLREMLAGHHRLQRDDNSKSQGATGHAHRRGMGLCNHRRTLHSDNTCDGDDATAMPYNIPHNKC